MKLLSFSPRSLGDAQDAGHLTDGHLLEAAQTERALMQRLRAMLKSQEENRDRPAKLPRLRCTLTRIAAPPFQVIVEALEKTRRALVAAGQSVAITAGTPALRKVPHRP